ncbi:MAG: aminotransferase class I/II-fold pyridoxal phosphate-dependent enzyme [gamma proteobacterium symbiont of Bathyaustriella thionipta]|nr:aminotransferase class I/II-fold pyridoxal phosphate-dependent enzyme [gamma proteobacterium symbiont of Bathyaustriella thionipta]
MFAKFETLANMRAAMAENGLDPVSVVIERMHSATMADINGRRTILAGTNNYLGLTFHPQCLQAAQQALMTEGSGTTGSRMANGNYAAHMALEQELADFYGVSSAIVFSTGYQANLALLSVLAGAEDAVLLDADCHASIYDGCKLGNAEIVRFRHNDPASLEKRLQRLAERGVKTLIVTEGIYSMLGDRSPLKEIVELKKKYGAYLMIDEAHSMGVLGENGRGLAEEAGVEDDVDFIVGTFSKSLGSIGGFCVSRWPELENVRAAMRPYIFTASPSPSAIATTRATLKLLRDGAELREQLWKNAHQLYQGLEDLGYNLGPVVSPVIPVILQESRQVVIEFWRKLLDRGVYVNLVLPPASPGDYCLLRCSISAAHSSAQIADMVNAFASLSNQGFVQARTG